MACFLTMVMDGSATVLRSLSTFFLPVPPGDRPPMFLPAPTPRPHPCYSEPCEHHQSANPVKASCVGPGILVYTL